MGDVPHEYLTSLTERLPATDVSKSNHHPII